MGSQTKQVVFFLFVAATLSVIFLRVLSHPVRAQVHAGSIQIGPTFQEVVLSETATDVSVKVQLINSSENDQTFLVKAVDVQQFDSNGNIAFSDKPTTGQDTTISDMVTLTPNQVTVPKQSSVYLPITVHNHQNVSPGGHYVSVLAQLVQPASDTQVVIPAVSSFLLIRKEDGARYNLSLMKPKLQGYSWWRLPENFTLSFENQGNVHVIPRGVAQISDIWGRKVAKSILNENSLYVFPGTQREIEQKFQYQEFVLPISLLHIQTVGTSQPGNIPFDSSDWVVFVHPVVPVTAIALAIMLGWTLYRRYRSKKIQI